jgi:hypothetical protein
LTFTDLSEYFWGPKTEVKIKKRRCNSKLKLTNVILIKEEIIRGHRPEFFPSQSRTNNDFKPKKFNKNTNILNNSINTQTSYDPKKQEEHLVPIREAIECVIEKYCCCFCKYKGDRQELERHYYASHEEVFENIPGVYLSRKIELLMINGDKYFVKSTLRY